MKIEDLPDFPALRQLARALWKQGRTRGAAVFVGAGFSLNAQRVHEGAAKPPVWSNMADAMETRIGSAKDRFRDPLRLAEEFKAVLGQSALEGLIRELVPDDQWLPGPLHEKLVELPWVDILTTNWDTLLERAASATLNRDYEIVRCIEDIPTTRAPRVVKLHGSLPSNRPFIFSEEDYRTYPQRFAPFVNLVQQVLLENELCLIGFSGDDPNFLKWTGWIRDQLGDSARRIYLAGALHLGTAQRRLLELRNISPIDLSPLVAHLECSRRHQTATEMFLEYLRAATPKAAWEWSPHPTTRLGGWHPNSTAELIAAESKEQAREWASVRLNYPGWVVCPPRKREELKQDTFHVLRNPNALAAMSSKDRTQFVFEAAWRLDTALLPIGTWIKPIEASVEDEESWDELSHRDFVLMLLLRNAREDRDQTAFQKWAGELEGGTARNPEVAPSLVYEKCLWMRDALNFDELSKLVTTLRGSGPLWGLRQAALYCDLGDFRAARLCVDRARAESRELFSRDRNSIWTLSLLAWTTFIAGQLRDFSVSSDTEIDEIAILSSALHERNCDPWETITALDVEIEKSLASQTEARRTIEPRFEAGAYRDHGTTVRFGTSPGLINYEMDRLSDSVGIVPRTQHVVVLSKRMERAEPLTDYQNDADYLRLIRIIQAGGKEALDRGFGRIQIANLSPERVLFLREILSKALDYALIQITRRAGWTDQFWSNRAAMYTEVLSRLLVRAEPAEALAWFHKGIAFASDDRWRWRELFEPLDHLIKWSLSAIPPSRRQELLLDVVGFPLPDEIPHLSQPQQDWPDPWRWIDTSVLKRPESDRIFADRVSELIELVRTGLPETRGRASVLLARLQMGGVLTADEGNRFGEALWSRRASAEDFPSDTSLYSHMFLVLPSPNAQEARDLFKKRDHEPSSADYLIAIAGATELQKGGTRYQLYDSHEALEKLDRFLNWRPKPVPLFDLGQVAEENKRCLQALGCVIANAILSALSPGELVLEMADRIFSREADSLSICQAYPEVLRLLPSEEDRAVNGTIRAMLSRDSNVAWSGFNALYRWLRGTQRGDFLSIPRRLIEITLSVIETRREPGLLHALDLARHLTVAEILNISEMERLAGAIELIHLETAYDAAQREEAINVTTLTLVRAMTVRLAHSLKARNVKNQDMERWLNEAPSDPMPEVRFALGTSFD
ncbi:MAG: SIR2 family protein [Terracidiphilus sp.]